MPKIEFDGLAIECSPGDNLRLILKRHSSKLYNGSSSVLNCRGLGTCGTCAVKIKGDVSLKTRIEKWRLNFPPHTEADGLRLACQCHVLGDLIVTKHDGFWGHKITAR